MDEFLNYVPQSGTRKTPGFLGIRIFVGQGLRPPLLLYDAKAGLGHL